MRPEFWRGRRVLITGHTGFKGAWLSLWLHQLQCHVAGFALAPPTDPSLFHLAGVGEGIEDLRGDVRDPHALEAVLEGTRPEIVIHLAAQALVRASYQDPIGTYATNIMGTAHLLDAVRRTPSVRALVVVTSDKCYENRELGRGYREEDPMGGHDPYSSSKGCTELVTSAFRTSFFQSAEGPRTAIATARAGNVIGGGDWAADRLLPDLVKAFALGNPVLIRNPMATRPWQHVLEPLHGYLALAEQLFQGGPEACAGWNFGPRESDVHPVGWIADEVALRWGGGAHWVADPHTHPRETHALMLDISKSLEGLPWRPLLTIGEALDWTVRWYQGLRNGGSARDMTLTDIKEFQERLGSEGE